MRFSLARLLGTALLAAAGMLPGAGCAKIGEPQPPAVRIPKPSADLAARQVSDSVVLTVSEPVQNTDGSPATSLQRLELFRLTEDMKADESKGPMSEEKFMKRAVPILSIPSSRFSSYLQNQVFIIRDEFLLPKESLNDSHAFRYAVRFINNKNQTAGLGNQVRITPIIIPPPPEGLSAEVAQDSIKLKWTAPRENTDGSKPPRISGYNIYRSQEAEKFSPAPFNHELVHTEEFYDRNFQFDKTYYYAVSTVGSLQNPYAESFPSMTVAVAARDVFPPTPPEDFYAIPEGSSIILLWSPSSSPDAAGYRLYRQEQGGTARRLLKDELITALSFRDTHVERGTSYEYSIQAIDTHGNESTPVHTETKVR